jgi:hypothetical protein
MRFHKLLQSLGQRVRLDLCGSWLKPSVCSPPISPIIAPAISTDDNNLCVPDPTTSCKQLRPDSLLREPMVAAWDPGRSGRSRP